MSNEYEMYTGQPATRVYFAHESLFWHCFGGAIVSTVSLVLSRFVWHFWLQRFVAVIALITGLLFLLWLGIALAKRKWPDRARQEPMFESKHSDKQNPDLDWWILELFCATLGMLIVVLSWDWQLKHKGVLVFIAVIVILGLFDLIRDRIAYSFIWTKKA
jgi:hypothetical protein